jgi:hypothetical protein
LRIDLDHRHGMVQTHIALADVAAVDVPPTARPGRVPSSAMAGFCSAARDTKVSEVFSAPPKAPNIGR